MSYKNFIIENSVLISYSGTDDIVVIPAEVEKIGVGVFKHNHTIKEIVFDCKNLKSIEEEAFYGCSSLKGIEIPEGTVQIAKRAFMGCIAMEYIFIPSSVMVIGELATESSVTIFGFAGSEAEKYAKTMAAVFKTDFSNGLKLINNKNIEKENVTNQTFIVFGEKFTASSSLKRYHDILEHYSRRQEEFFDQMMTAVPIDYTPGHKVADGGIIFQNEIDSVINRLEKMGINILKGDVGYYCNDIADLLLRTFKLIVNTYMELSESAISDIKNQVQSFYDQAESQVTGLSYGYIGGGIGLAAYAFDDFFEKQKQRKKSYGVAEKQKTAYINERTAELNRTYKEIYKKFVPLFRKVTDLFIDSLLKCEIEQCIKHGLIDADIKDKYDVVKSSELMQGLYERKSPNAEYVLALALKFYPMNVSAHIYAVEKELSCDGLEELRDFLGLSEKLQPYKDEIKSKKFEKVLTRVLECANASDGVKVIKKNLFLSEEEIEKILIRYSTVITEAFEKIIDYISTENCNIKEKCRQELNMIIDKESCEFFYEHGVVPIKSSIIPQNARLDFEKLVYYLETAVTEKQEQKEKQFKYVVEVLEDAKTLEDYENIINSLSEISGYKNATELLDGAVAKKQALADSMLGEIEHEIDMAKTWGELDAIESKLWDINEYVSISDALSLLSAKKNKTLTKLMHIRGIRIKFMHYVSVTQTAKVFRCGICIRASLAKEPV